MTSSGPVATRRVVGTWLACRLLLVCFIVGPAQRQKEMNTHFTWSPGPLQIHQFRPRKTTKSLIHSSPLHPPPWSLFMPPKLPGLCWDEQRNRYFAESSTPGAFAPTRTPSNSNTSITVPPEAVRRESQVHNRTFRRQLQHGGIWGLMEMQRSAPSQFNARINTANQFVPLLSICPPCTCTQWNLLCIIAIVLSEILLGSSFTPEIF